MPVDYIGCKIGSGTIIRHESLVNIYGGCEIGKNCNIAAFVEIGKNVKIGNNCRIGAFTFIPEGVKIGNNCFIGPHVCFTNDVYPPSKKKHWGNIVICDNVSIGAGVVILPNVVIGRNVTIGAGSIITKDISPNQIVLGGHRKLELKSKGKENEGIQEISS